MENRLIGIAATDACVCRRGLRRNAIDHWSYENLQIWFNTAASIKKEIYNPVHHRNP